MELTLAMIKPNGVEKGLIGEIILRYEKARLGISAMAIRELSREDVEGFYAEHRERGFFSELVEFMSSGPTVLLVLHGKNAIESVRILNGATDPSKASPGTIRHDFAPNVGKNIVHASDSSEAAKREIAYWFKDAALVYYPPHSYVC